SRQNASGSGARGRRQETPTTATRGSPTTIEFLPEFPWNYETKEEINTLVRKRQKAQPAVTRLGGRLGRLGSVGRQRDRRQNEAVCDKQTAAEATQLAAVEKGTRNQQTCRKAPTPAVDRDHGVFEAEPSFGQREPGLVDRLLDAEEQPVPVRPRRLAGELAQELALLGQGDVAEQAFRQRLVGLGVDADRHQVARPRDRTRPVAVAVRDAADDPSRPERLAARPG